MITRESTCWAGSSAGANAGVVGHRPPGRLWHRRTVSQGAQGRRKGELYISQSIEVQCMNACTCTISQCSAVADIDTAPAAGPTRLVACRDAPGIQARRPDPQVDYLGEKGLLLVCCQA